MRKFAKKEERESFYGRSKNISAENNSTPTNAIPALSRMSLLAQQHPTVTNNSSYANVW